MKLSKASLLLVGASILLPVVGTAAAQTLSGSVTVPGLDCVLANGTATTNNGGIRNTSTSTMTLRCPIVHDTTNNTNVSASVLVRDPSPTGDISCGLFRATPSTGTGATGGWSVASQGNFVTVGAQDGFRVLPLGSVDDSTSSGVVFYIRCELPPTSADGHAEIAAFTYTE